MRHPCSEARDQKTIKSDDTTEDNLGSLNLTPGPRKCQEREQQQGQGMASDPGLPALSPRQKSFEVRQDVSVLSEKTKSIRCNFSQLKDTRPSPTGTKTVSFLKMERPIWERVFKSLGNPLPFSEPTNRSASLLCHSGSPRFQAYCLETWPRGRNAGRAGRRSARHGVSLPHGQTCSLGSVPWVSLGAHCPGVGLPGQGS